MKTLLAILTLALVLSAEAAQMEVMDAQIGMLDYTDRPTLCLTVVRDLETDELLGIVEDITDCFYARKASRNPSMILELSDNAFRKMNSGKMLIHLQEIDPALKFLWSNHE
ncbi:MAG: hypothetical protein ACLGG0_08840 [Bacteriovoracia bacterium]